MGKLFESVVMDGENIRANVAPLGWRVLVSINGVCAERIKALAQETAPENWETELNSLIPSLMSMTDAPLGEDVTVVVKDVSGTEETLTIPYHPVDKKVATAALIKNFEGIVALAKAAGLTEEEINVVFASSLMEYEKASAMGGVDLQEAMGNMMENMMAGPGGSGKSPDCKAQ